MDIVAEVLEKQAKNLEKYKPIIVDKVLDLELDVGTLLAVDNNELDLQKLKSNTSDYIKSLTRDNSQLLINEVWTLPTKRHEDAIVVELPAATTILPRERRVPVPRPPTKWEQFAKEKGIQKKKKEKLTYDQALQKWIPTHGFRRTQADKEKSWVLEVPGNADPNEDQFEKISRAKTERKAKNELQRLRNVAKAKGTKIPRVGLPNSDTASAQQLSTAVTVARHSTASIGKFQAKLPKEKEARGLGVKEIIPGVNRKRKPAPISGDAEKAINLDVVNSILNKRPKIDIEKAVSKQIYKEESERAEEKRTQKPKAGRSGKKRSGGTSLKGRGASKPKAGRGERNPGKRSAGRKRR